VVTTLNTSLFSDWLHDQSDPALPLGVWFTLALEEVKRGVADRHRVKVA
jgi:hypothetical protein